MQILFKWYACEVHIADPGGGWKGKERVSFERGSLARAYRLGQTYPLTLTYFHTSSNPII